MKNEYEMTNWIATPLLSIFGAFLSYCDLELATKLVALWGKPSTVEEKDIFNEDQSNNEFEEILASMKKIPKLDKIASYDVEHLLTEEEFMSYRDVEHHDAYATAREMPLAY